MRRSLSISCVCITYRAALQTCSVYPKRDNIPTKTSLLLQLAAFHLITFWAVYCENVFMRTEFGYHFQLVVNFKNSKSICEDV